MTEPRSLTKADLPELSRRFRAALNDPSCAPEDLQSLFEATLKECIDTAEPEPGAGSHLLLEAWILKKPESAAADDGDIADWPRRYAGWLRLDRLPVDRDEVQEILRFVEETGAELDPEDQPQE